MKKDFRILTAFTLAEVLLVLVIIGVISALTIPSLNQNIKKQENVSALIKADSTLSQAVTRVKTDKGPIGFGSAWRDADEFWKVFPRQLNSIKICSNGESGCFTDGAVKKLDGSDGENYNGKDYSVRTADGVCYQYTSGADSAADLGLSTEDAGAVIGSFAVDVNGDKGPNKIGEDVFFFALVKNKGIVAAGSGSSADCCYGQDGMTCSAKVLQEGKINYARCGGGSGDGSSGSSGGSASSSGGTPDVSSSSSTSSGSSSGTSTGSSSGGTITSSGGSSSGSSSGGSSSGSSTSSGSSGGGNMTGDNKPQNETKTGGGGAPKNQNRVTADDSRGSNLGR